MDKDEIWMQRALDLAILGSGYAAPNPLVGCVIVKNNQVIGEGWHAQYGQSHAEVNAINSLLNISEAENSTIYVTLEPCSHTGKTPPCTDLLIKLKIARVVISNTDPNPIVSGKGIAKLIAAGIQVSQGILNEKGFVLNRKFFHFHLYQRPYITLKYACSQDNFIADADGKAIAFSNQISQQLVHKMRAENQGILIGIQTAIQDNPTLNVRYWHGRNPIRIIIDPENRMPKDLILVMDDEPLIVFTKNHADINGGKNWIALGKYDFLAHLMQKCFELGIQSILIEGGSITANSFLKEGFVDEVWKIENRTKRIKGILGPSTDRLTWSRRQKVGLDNFWYNGKLS